MKYNLHLFLYSLIFVAGFSSKVTSAQNYTKPKEVSRSNTSFTVSSLVFSSTVLPWGFDWRINDETETVVLVSVTLSSTGEALIITPGPTSKFSNRYNISNHPSPIGSTSTPFLSTVTITDWKEGETLSLSVPGLASKKFTKDECLLDDETFYGASNITCMNNPCTPESMATLTCPNQVDVVCGFDGLFNRNCTEKPLEDKLDYYEDK